MRTFISIEIPEEIKDEIIKIQKQLPEFHGKKTEKENLHLTLKFLGEIDESKIEQIQEKLKEIKLRKFKSEIDSIGVFSEKFVRIIWLHIKNCDELQREIDKKLLDLFEPENRFMSHLTIARIKNIKDKKRFLEELNKIKIQKIKFNVGSFYLMKSELYKKGPRYSLIEKYNLD